MAVASGTPRTLIEGDTSRKPTYSASMVAVSVAALASDIMTLTGGTGALVKVVRVVVSGIATAAGAFDVLLVKRSAANSGGTAALLDIVPRDSNSATPAAIARSYTANPTVGTGLGTVAAARITVTTAAGAIGNAPQAFELLGPQSQPVALRGSGEVLALNLNATTITGGSITAYVEWTEE